MEEAVIKRILPHSTEAESAVIGAMLMNKDAILETTEILTGEDFYQRSEEHTSELQSLYS